MKIITLKENKPLPIKASVITVGNFDGIHKGHELLIKNVVKRARAKKISSVVITFEPHTRAVLSPKRQPVLSTLEEKAILLKRYGVEYLACIPFNKKFAALSAEDFVEKILKKELHARQWVMGETHRFGKNHRGNKNFSHNSKGKNDIYVVAVKSLGVKHAAISSTEIRAGISEGRIAEAVKMLGHPYLIVSPRISGVKKGPNWDFQHSISHGCLPTRFFLLREFTQRNLNMESINGGERSILGIVRHSGIVMFILNSMLLITPSNPSKEQGLASGCMPWFVRTRFLKATRN